MVKRYSRIKPTAAGAIRVSGIPTTEARMALGNRTLPGFEYAQTINKIYLLKTTADTLIGASGLKPANLIKAGLPLKSITLGGNQSWVLNTAALTAPDAILIHENSDGLDVENARWSLLPVVETIGGADYYVASAFNTTFGTPIIWKTGYVRGAIDMCIPSEALTLETFLGRTPSTAGTIARQQEEDMFRVRNKATVWTKDTVMPYINETTPVKVEITFNTSLEALRWVVLPSANPASTITAVSTLSDVNQQKFSAVTIKF